MDKKHSIITIFSSGKDGSLSATGLIGTLLCFLAMIMISIIFIFYFVNTDEASHIMEFVDKSIIILGIGSALLGCRKITGAMGGKKGADIVKFVEESKAEENKPNS